MIGKDIDPRAQKYFNQDKGWLVFPFTDSSYETIKDIRVPFEGSSPTVDEWETAALAVEQYCHDHACRFVEQDFGRDQAGVVMLPK